MRGRTPLRKPPNETGERLAGKSPSPSGSAATKAHPGDGPAADGLEVGHVTPPNSDQHLPKPTSPTPTPPLKGRGSEGPERTCVLTRTAGAREDLIRLALSPDGEILPDVRAKAPGRGAWIGVDRLALEQAQANGKLKAALSRAFKTGDIRIPDELGDRIETALRQAALDRLGLEARAGTLLTGAEKIETACRKGEVRLLLHADDAGDDGSRKLDQAWRVGGGQPQGLAIPAGRA